MERNEFKPVVVEVAEVGREVVKLVFNSEEEFIQWSSKNMPPELPESLVEPV